MIVTALFVLLSVCALIGAGGALFCRQALYCGFSFLLCAIALTGLYLLLDTRFLAATQLTVGVCLTGIVTVVSLSNSKTSVRPRHPPWYALIGLVFAALAYWGIARGRIGVSVISSPPVWAVRGEHTSAFGRELVTQYSVPFALLGLLLLTGIVSTGYLIRQDRRPQAEGRSE
jgi:NADH-quinone oxidoreductase subunit J